MSQNVGIVPPDFSSSIGQFRLLAQDTNYTDLIPDEDGLGSYDLFSDAEIAGYLAMYSGYSAYRPVGAAYQGLAARASMSAKMVKDYDLQIDLTKRAVALQATADALFQRADKEDALTGATSTFGLSGPADDTVGEYMNALPYLWNSSPLVDFPFGAGAAMDIAALGDGLYGDGVVVTDGTEAGTDDDAVFDGGELI